MLTPEDPEPRLGYELRSGHTGQRASEERMAIEHETSPGVPSVEQGMPRESILCGLVERTVLTTAILLLASGAFAALRWRLVHDVPLLHYAAWLINEQGRVPYLDIFETSMPGTFAFHVTMTKLVGYGDGAYRLVNLGLLAVLMIMTGRFMHRFGSGPALWAPVLFGLLYLTGGPEMALQRDYLGLFPIAAALLAIPAVAPRAQEPWRFVAVGLGPGVASLFKPHLAICLPILVGALFVLARRQTGSQGSGTFVYAQWAGSRIALACLAAVSPLLCAGGWLAAQGSLPHFLDILLRYLPLHNSLTGYGTPIEGSDKLWYLLEMTKTLGGYRPTLIAAILGVLYAGQAVWRREPEKRVTVVMLGLLLVAYVIYPTLAGKFWLYHYTPMVYFATICTAMLAVTSDLAKRWLAVVVLATLLIRQLPAASFVSNVYSSFRSSPQTFAPKAGRVDEIAAWLGPRLRAGDTVQPLDWTSGCIHAMLITGAPLATRFMYDYHFYHHVSTPYIQSLRQAFIHQLRESSPRFILEAISPEKPWVSGAGTTREFPALRCILQSHYRPTHVGTGWIAWERRDDKSHDGTPQ
jgi:hypothetical protein